MGWVSHLSRLVAYLQQVSVSALRPDAPKRKARAAHSPGDLASDIVKAGRIRVIFSKLPRLLRRQWSMHPDIESALNEVARHTRRAMTEPAHFASRPWTQADDDKLRRLAVAGLSSVSG